MSSSLALRKENVKHIAVKIDIFIPVGQPCTGRRRGREETVIDSKLLVTVLTLLHLLHEESGEPSWEEVGLAVKQGSTRHTVQYVDMGYYWDRMCQ